MEDCSAKSSNAQILVFFLLGILAGYAAGDLLQAFGGALSGIGPTGRFIPQSQIAGTPVPASVESSVTITVPAVDSYGNGAILNITVQKRGGYGETLIDINNLVFWFDTQQSIRTARAVAGELTGIDVSTANLVYIVDSDAGIVGGPSAGAALTIATIAALEERTINRSVMITGEINPDGTIGPVGGITEKAIAAKASGAELFLVPKGQSVDTTLVPRRACRTIAGFNYCSTAYIQATTGVSEAAGIRVEEVSTMQDAEKYFFG